MSKSFAVVVRAFDGEAPYLQSFIDHHRRIGVDQFYVVLAPDTAPLCRAIAAENDLCVIESDGQRVRDATDHVREDYVAVIDADEYLHPALIDFIEQESFQSLAMPWRMTATLDADGFASPSKRFFTFPQIKSVMRTRHLVRLGLHSSNSKGKGARLGIRDGLSFPVHHYYLRGLDDLLLKEGGVVKRTLSRSSGRRSVELGSLADGPGHSVESFPSRHARVAYVLRMLESMPMEQDPYSLSIDQSMLDQLRDDADQQTKAIRNELLASVNSIKDVFLESTIREQIINLQLCLEGDPARTSFQKRVLNVLKADCRLRQAWPRRLSAYLQSLRWSSRDDGEA